MTKKNTTKTQAKYKPRDLLHTVARRTHARERARQDAIDCAVTLQLALKLRAPQIRFSVDDGLEVVAALVEWACLQQAEKEVWELVE